MSAATPSFRRGRAVMAILLLALMPLLATAQVGTVADPPRFNTPAEAERFHALTEELRCVKCQNQSLADSNAQIAQDLRQEVLLLMRQGKTDSQIKHYLVARYGEFVLYQPRVEPSTWLLWFGPAALLLAGGIVVAGIVRKRSAGKLAPAADNRADDNRANDDGQEW